jgi:hypothetical protein
MKEKGVKLKNKIEEEDGEIIVIGKPRLVTKTRELVHNERVMFNSRG